MEIETSSSFPFIAFLSTFAGLVKHQASARFSSLVVLRFSTSSLFVHRFCCYFPLSTCRYNRLPLSRILYPCIVVSRIPHPASRITAPLSVHQPPHKATGGQTHNSQLKTGRLDAFVIQCEQGKKTMKNYHHDIRQKIVSTSGLLRRMRHSVG